MPGPGEPFDGAVSPDDLSRPLYGASFGQAVKRFYKNYANFSGRASRSEFWWVTLYCFLISFIPGLFLLIAAGGITTAALSAYSYGGGGISDTVASGLAGAGAATIVLFAIGALASAVLFFVHIVPSIALSWRRLHDAKLPGPLWFIHLVGIVPGIGQFLSFPAYIAMIVLYCLPPKAEARAKFPSNKA